MGGALRLLGGGEEGAALDALRSGEGLLGEAEALDLTLEPLASRLGGVVAEAEDLAAALRDYLDGLDVDPAHRDAVEQRYDRFRTLARKYGASADDIIAFAGEASERIGALERLEADETELLARLDQAKAAAVAAAGRLSEARAAAAPAFAEAVLAELKGLAMPHARFAVELQPRGEGWQALGPRGAEEAEFVFSANPGLPPRPLRETASGGELSRAMLAIKSFVHLGNDVQTLIFDEVDTGIGGVTANVLGERLAALAEHHADRLHHAPAAGRRLRRAPVRDHEVERPGGRHDRDDRRPRRGRRSSRRALPHAGRHARRHRGPGARAAAPRAGGGRRALTRPPAAGSRRLPSRRGPLLYLRPK